MGSGIGEELANALALLKPEIRRMLVEDLPSELRHAERSYVEQDWESLLSHVHRMHGSASFCHLRELNEVCVGIETGLKAKMPPTKERMLAFSSEVSRVLTAIGLAPESTE